MSDYVPPKRAYHDTNKIKIQDIDEFPDTISYSYNTNGYPKALLGSKTFVPQYCSSQYMLPLSSLRTVLARLKKDVYDSKLFEDENDVEAEAFMLPFFSNIGSLGTREHADPPLKKSLRFVHRNLLARLPGEILVVGNSRATCLNWFLENVTVMTRVSPDRDGKWVTPENVNYKDYDVCYVMYAHDCPVDLADLRAEFSDREYIETHLDYAELLKDKSQMVTLTDVRRSADGRIDFDAVVAGTPYPDWNDAAINGCRRIPMKHFMNINQCDDITGSQYSLVWYIGPLLQALEVGDFVPNVGLPVTKVDILSMIIDNIKIAEIKGTKDVQLRISGGIVEISEITGELLETRLFEGNVPGIIIAQGLMNCDTGCVQIVDVFNSSILGTGEFSYRYSAIDGSIATMLSSIRIERIMWRDLVDYESLYAKDNLGLLFQNFRSGPGTEANLNHGEMYGTSRYMWKRRRIKMRMYLGVPGHAPGMYELDLDDFDRDIYTVIGPVSRTDNHYRVQCMRSQLNLMELGDGLRSRVGSVHGGIRIGKTGKSFIIGTYTIKPVASDLNMLRRDLGTNEQEKERQRIRGDRDRKDVLCREKEEISDEDGDFM